VEKPKELTYRQYDVLRWVRIHSETHQISPTLQEIADGCECGTHQAARDHLMKLEESGYITRQGRRNIKILFDENRKPYEGVSDRYSKLINSLTRFAKWITAKQGGKSEAAMKVDSILANHERTTDGSEDPGADEAG
jgi:SOS-response transcriptional repressor LexA